MKRFFKVLLGVLLVAVALVLYLKTTVYTAEDYATACKTQEIENVRIIEDKKYIGYYSLDSDKAIIFYPGGLVDYDAYCGYAAALAERGMSVFICKMPLDLAVLKMNAANKIIEDYPEMQHWYIAGHSLGGAMAASYLKKNASRFEGLILMAGYSTADLSNENIRVLSIYGSNDQIMQKDKYDKYLTNLPSLTELVIEGGNHENFGDYGHQKGDGTALISQKEQMEIAIDAIEKFVMH